ncbi:hypothetical protein MUK42_16242 [Musa troglodytarum]|uniref:Uncharacterized protein n=1 Tax=Musa troglodytarum TaxID=320322 RepID=A0A9E7HEF8_9LILI|nr:hypothetical protein MUK42_16242 [Musa troglodytarum]
MALHQNAEDRLEKPLRRVEDGPSDWGFRVEVELLAASETAFAFDGAAAKAISSQRSRLDMESFDWWIKNRRDISAWPRTWKDEEAVPKTKPPGKSALPIAVLLTLPLVTPQMAMLGEERLVFVEAEECWNSCVLAEASRPPNGPM